MANQCIGDGKIGDMGMRTGRLGNGKRKRRGETGMYKEKRHGNREIRERERAN